MSPEPNGEVFYTLREAQILIERWRHHFNTVRPHSALHYRPPAPESMMPIDQELCPKVGDGVIRRHG